VILGLVYDPLHRECFRAVSGKAQRSMAIGFALSVVNELDRALLATDFPTIVGRKQISI